MTSREQYQFGRVRCIDLKPYCFRRVRVESPVSQFVPVVRVDCVCSYHIMCLGCVTFGNTVLLRYALDACVMA